MNTFFATAIAVLSLLLSSTAFAGPQLDWNDLEEGGEFKLHQDISLDNGPVFKRGERFSTIAYGGVPQLSTVWMTLRVVDCKDPDAKSDVTVILPEQHEQDPWRDRSAMLELYPNCELLIEVEGADYYTPSLFER